MQTHARSCEKPFRTVRTHIKSCMDPNISPLTVCPNVDAAQAKMNNLCNL